MARAKPQAPRPVKPRPLTGRALRGMKGKQGPGVGRDAEAQGWRDARLASGQSRGRLIGGPASLPRGRFKEAPERYKAEAGAYASTWRQAMADLVRRVKAARDLAIELFKSGAIEVVAMIVDATPVDTGTARRGWTGPTFEASGNKVTARVLNAVPYIVFLEFGWSTQAPQGMVRVSLERARRDLRDKIARLA